MKKSTGIYLACLAIGCGMQAFAEESTRLMVVANDSEGVAMGEAAVDLESKLRFAEDGVEVYTDDVLSAVFHYSDLSNLSFRYDTGTGITQPVAETSLRLRTNPVAESLEFIGFCGNPVSLSVCGLKGENLIDDPTWSGTPVDVSALAPGLYLARIGETATFKFIKK